jgi:hypothetical protein
LAWGLGWVIDAPLTLLLAGAQDEDTSAEVGEKRKGGDDGVRDAPPGRKLLRLSREERAAKKSMFGSERALLEKLHFEREFDHQGLLDTLADRDLRHIYKHNPHLRQVFVEGYDLYRVARPFGAEDRYITDADGQTRWRGRASEVITVEHWGQRKLIISEIEFLTEFHSPGRTVVYVGAAPGSHINFLATVLFPDLLFVLVDPAPFEAWPAENVEIRNEYFDSEAARKFLGADCLLISDIRGREVDDMAAEEREEVVLEEMMLQKEWVKLMRPAGASLKFRLPYLRSKCPSVRYLDGRLYLPVWGGRTTSESRLFVTDPDSEKEYDVQTYDNTMFHFNISTRVSYFEEKRGEAEGFDHCYDCMAECFVLQQYLRKMHDIKDDDVLHSGSGRLSNMLSRAIGSRGRNRIGWSGGEKYAFK